MSEGTNANLQPNNADVRIPIGPPLLTSLIKGQKIFSGPYSVTVTEDMVRARERENEEIYRRWVAQLSRFSREIDDNDYYEEFKNNEVRRKFIRNVFSVLTLLLLFTVCGTSIFIFVEEARLFLLRNWFLIWVSLITFMITYIKIVCFEAARRVYPYNWICLSILTLSMTYMTACLCLAYQVEAVMSAGIVTAAATLVISVLATVSSFDLTKQNGLLVIVGLVAFAIIFIITPIASTTNLSALNMILGVVGSLIISMYLYYDVQTIMGDRNMELKPDEVVFAVVRLYVDILIMFQYILRMFR